MEIKDMLFDIYESTTAYTSENLFTSKLFVKWELKDFFRYFVGTVK
jgi:hypothetical protein